ncbi:class I SAM-dependent methyltransferase [Sulfoacidibacillus thermotolerans]|uniref:Methyltransferase domain-containing protein n=1 Tax=Sulfoacidibacillus thermotolerans TaxID=1765684 RepID=A0A2U3D664_SULT2|nr:class I SAM-dependent methyltransferase [Sulfoacidibacillus thermotolerans]PWI56764.1 hypothetical protein BM613_12110 [Sulfoacidibacillus thermotolerans]
MNMQDLSGQHNFYRAFEDRYRGSRELIKSRLQAYLPFILPLQTIYPECQTIDLGCGRGEWLELLTEYRFQPFGVDLDRGMLMACKERGFSVAEMDAVTALRDLPKESQVVVSGFHIAEHLPFEALQAIFEQALRVLKPGGFLILETPNPENIQVATANFYLDPTHQRPLPPLLLSFLAEFYGFSRVKVLRLQEPQELYAREKFSLSDVIGGVSPDYAIVAQKNALPSVLARFEEAFAKNYGVSLEMLEGVFEQRILNLENQVQQTAQAMKEVNRRALEAIRSASEVEKKIVEMEIRIRESVERSESLELQVYKSEQRAIAAERKVIELERNLRGGE